MQAAGAGGHRIWHRQQVDERDADGLCNGQGWRRLRESKRRGLQGLGWDVVAQDHEQRSSKAQRSAAPRAPRQIPATPAQLTKDAHAPAAQVQTNLQKPMHRSRASGAAARCPAGPAARGVAALCCCSSCAISCMRSVRMGWRRALAGEGAASGVASMAGGGEALAAAATAVGGGTPPQRTGCCRLGAGSVLGASVLHWTRAGQAG